MIEIYLLEQLCAFEECATLSRAAQMLHISQPALTHSMQKLEEQMGVSLFERTKNRITLNENGKLTAQYARRILAMENDMKMCIRDSLIPLQKKAVGCVQKNRRSGFWITYA